MRICDIHAQRASDVPRTGLWCMTRGKGGGRELDIGGPGFCRRKIPGHNPTGFSFADTGASSPKLDEQLWNLFSLPERSTWGAGLGGQ